MVETTFTEWGRIQRAEKHAAEIIKYLCVYNEATAKEIGECCRISPQQATAVLYRLIAVGKLERNETVVATKKIPFRGHMRVMIADKMIDDIVISSHWEYRMVDMEKEVPIKKITFRLISEN